MSGLAGLVRRAAASVSYRSAFVYRRALAALPPRSAGSVPSAGSLPCTYLTFGGLGHRLMLRASVGSLAAAWPRHPRLVITSDGTLDRETVAHDLRGWPGDWELRSWEEALPVLESRGLGDLARFARREVMARKMAAVVAQALSGPVVYADVDVLWFRPPPSLDGYLGEAHRGDDPVLHLSEDFQPSYDPRWYPERIPELIPQPFLCAGALFAQGDVLGHVRQLGDFGDFLAEAAETGIGVTEQTLLALAHRRLGGEAWSAREIDLSLDDRVSFRPTFRGRAFAARHYVGPVRHLFWRDALALRTGSAVDPESRQGAA